MLAVNSLSIDSIRSLLDALEKVLDSRMHRREYLGEEIFVKGSLSKALGIPELKRALSRSGLESQQRAVSRFLVLWTSLSERTQNLALHEAGLYIPKDLDWDDPRSNRRPL